MAKKGYKSKTKEKRKQKKPPEKCGLCVCECLVNDKHIDGTNPTRFTSTDNSCKALWIHLRKLRK